MLRHIVRRGRLQPAALARGATLAHRFAPVRYFQPRFALRHDDGRLPHPNSCNRYTPLPHGSLHRGYMELHDRRVVDHRLHQYGVLASVHNAEPYAAYSQYFFHRVPFGIQTAPLAHPARLLVPRSPPPAEVREFFEWLNNREGPLNTFIHS